MSDDETIECVCSKTFTTVAKLTKHQIVCPTLMMMRMMESMSANNRPQKCVQKKKRDKPKFSIVKYLEEHNNVIDWKIMMRTKTYVAEEYDLFYNYSAAEAMTRMINNWLSNIDKDEYPFIITNTQKSRFMLYRREGEEWKKYSGDIGYSKILDFVECLSARMLFADNSNIIYEKYPLAAMKNTTFREDARDQIQRRVSIIGGIAKINDHLREVAKSIISNFVVEKEEGATDDEVDEDSSEDDE